MSDDHFVSALMEPPDTPAVIQDETGTFNIRSLKEAFDLFNQKTRNLQNSYNGLKKQVDDVNEELRKKNEILKRKIMELDTTRDYLNNILESMPSGLIAVDLLGRIMTFNKAAEKITGYERYKVIGRNYKEVFPDDTGRHSLMQAVMSQPSKRFHDEQTLATKDGRTIPVGVSISPARDGENRVIGAIEIFSDLTEIKALEEQVRHADRLTAIGEIAATVAHEIRNPLGGIEGFAALLERDLSGDDGKHEMALNIVEGARCLNRIVSNLLDFTRPVKVCLEECSIEEIIESAISLVSGKYGNFFQGISIHREFSFDGRIMVDRGQMLQVFINLILNAIEAMESGGVLTIATERNNGSFNISIGDTGCGIPCEVMKRLFMPFVTTKKEGNGLGLSAVMKIISAHKGTIKVQTGCGEGTVFFITLPATKTEET